MVGFLDNLDRLNQWKHECFGHLTSHFLQVSRSYSEVSSSVSEPAEQCQATPRVPAEDTSPNISLCKRIETVRGSRVKGTLAMILGTRTISTVIIIAISSGAQAHIRQM